MERKLRQDDKGLERVAKYQERLEEIAKKLEAVGYESRSASHSNIRPTTEVRPELNNDSSENQ